MGNIDLLKILGIVISLSSLGFALWQRKRKKITYTVESVLPLFSVRHEVKDKVQILFNGKPVSNPYLIVLRIRNAGNEPILSNDFIDPITFDFGKKAEILQSSVVETNPASIIKKLSIKEQLNRIIIEPFLLNRGNFFTLNIIVSEFEEPVIGNALINGVELKEVIKYESTSLLTFDKLSLSELLYRLLFTFLTLLILSLVGAIKSPGLPNAGSAIDTYALDFVLLLLPAILLSLIAFFLGSGIRRIKNRIQSVGLAYASAFIIGGVLALFTLFNFPYSAQVNLVWLGTSWYGPWITTFIIGISLILAFTV